MRATDSPDESPVRVHAPPLAFGTANPSVVIHQNGTHNGLQIAAHPLPVIIENGDATR